MRRVTVVGPPGSGKSTLATHLAAAVDVDAVDLDQLFHRPGWEPTPTPEFRSMVADRLARAEADRAGWVVAGNYLMCADLTQGRSDTIVWLDLPRRTTVSRVVRRSAGRVVRRERLWAGNVETLRGLLTPSESIIVEAWRKHPTTREKYETLSNTPLWSGASIHRLRSPAAVVEFRATFAVPG